MVKVTGIPWSTAGLEVGLEDQVRLRGLQVFTLNKRSQVVLQRGECPGWTTPLSSVINKVSNSFPKLETSHFRGKDK